MSAEKNKLALTSLKSNKLRKISKGDYLVAYLTKVSRFVSILEVTEEALVSDEQKWTEGLFPVRVGAKIIKQLSIPSAIPMSAFLGKLSFLKQMRCQFLEFGLRMFVHPLDAGKLRMEKQCQSFIDKVIESGENLNLKSGVSKQKMSTKADKLKKLNRVGSLIKTHQKAHIR